MIKELLEKRIGDYLRTTKDILGIYEDNLIRAIRLFTKTDKDIQITSVYLYQYNPNFIVNVYKIHVIIGDRIQNPDGSITIVDKDNINTVSTNDLTLILPIKTIEELSSVEIFKQIEYIDNYIKKNGVSKYNNLLATGISSFDSNTDDTDIIDITLEGLDELQLFQYNLYMEDKERRLH